LTWITAGTAVTGFGGRCYQQDAGRAKRKS
jgi:hypothetical protein